jgi:GT2 family glycosyltransferase
VPAEILEDISIVVPTLGRDLLRRCLESIAAGSAWPAELIVVDQGAAEEVPAWLTDFEERGLSCRHVRSDERGIAAATNLGVRLARTPFVAITHDDCRVAPDWLKIIAGHVARAGQAVTTGRVEPEGDGIVLTIVTSREQRTYTEPLIDGDVLFPPNMALPVSVFERTGYFDEHPSLRMAGEDNEWAYRVLRASVPIKYEPDAVVYHLAWMKRSDLVSVHRRYARGQGSFYGKYLLRRDSFIARRAVRDLVRAPWLLLRGIFTLNRDLMAMGFGEVTGLPVGIVNGMRGRKT